MTHEPLVFSTARVRLPRATRSRSAAAGSSARSSARRSPTASTTSASTPIRADRDVVLVGGTIDDATTLELYDLACGLVTDGAYRLRW